MKITDEYVENRLHDWSIWAAKGRENLGYPSCSADYRVAKGIPPSPPGPRAPQTNADAEEIEQLVCDLRKDFEEEAEIIKDYYLKRSSTIRVATIAADRNLPYREFFKRLRHAKDLLRLLLIVAERDKNFFAKRVANY